jgi:enoyl-CoA hydratase
MAGSQTAVTYTRRIDIAYLTFSTQPAGKPPTLDLQVLDEIEACLAAVQDELNDLKALVVTSDSDRYFIVGANISALEVLAAESIVPWVERGHTVFNQLESLPLPVIAVVRGFALGGGLELALACDLIAAASSARFGQPEARLGLVPGWGATQRLVERVGASRAKELFFTGRTIDADQAYHMGLVNFSGTNQELDRFLESTFEELRACSAQAVASIKALVHQNTSKARDVAREAEAAASQRCMRSGDTQERIRAFLEKR